ncbi:MAG: MMPL family transporter [Planctomycetaceae bacterium]
MFSDDPRMNLLVHKLRGIHKANGEWYDGNPYVAEVHPPLETLQKIAGRGIEPEEAIDRMTGILVGPGLLRVKLTAAGETHLKQIQEEIRSRIKEELGVDAYIVAPDVKISEEELAKQVSPKLLERVKHGFTPAPFIHEDADEEEESESENASTTIAANESLTAEDFLASEPYDFQVGWPLMHVKQELSQQVEELITSIHTKQFPEESPVANTFYTPGSRVALSLTLSHYAKPESDQSDAKKEAIARLKEDAAACAIPVDSLRIGGSPYASAELSHYVHKAIDNQEAVEKGQYAKVSPIGLSTLVAILLAFIMLRSFRLAALVLIVSIYTTLLTVSFVPLTGGNLNMVLIVMPTLLTVLTLSAAIHVANYWKHAAHENIHTAVVQSVRMAWQPCALASVTTAIGLLSLTTSPLSPVRDFGAYSAVGCLVSLLMVLLGLPALLQYWPAHPPKVHEVNRSPWRKLGNVLYRYRTLVSLACLAAMCWASWGLHYFTTETKVIRYFPDDAKIVEDYNYLEENLAGIIPIDTVLIFDSQVFDSNTAEAPPFWKRMELVRKVQDAIKTHPEISGTLSLATFQPDVDPPKGAGFARARYFKKLNLVRDVILKPSEENQGRHEALKYFNVSPENTEYNNKNDELWRISAQVSIMSDMDYGVLTEQLNKLVQDTIQAEAEEVPGVKFKITGMVPLFLRTQQAVLESLINSFGIAFLLIGGVMIILLKNPIAGILTMLPNILPIGVVFGLISWGGNARRHRDDDHPPRLPGVLPWTKPCTC